MYIQTSTFTGRTIFWSPAKDALLRRTRHLGFQDVVDAIAGGRLLWMIDHPSPESYPGQKVLAVALKGYVYLVPCEVHDETVELKTFYPSRKAVREWRKGRRMEGGPEAP